jgi:hypothetical protein
MCSIHINCVCHNVLLLLPNLHYNISIFHIPVMCAPARTHTHSQLVVCTGIRTYININMCMNQYCKSNYVRTIEKNIMLNMIMNIPKNMMFNAHVCKLFGQYCVQ